MKKFKALFLAATLLAAPVVATVAPVSEISVEAATTFKDVTTKHTYYKEISEMTAQGIIKGYEDGTFKPTQTLSRQHAATLVYRALQQKGITLKKVKTVELTDVKTTSEHYKALKALAEADLLTVSNKKVNPNQALTRGEMAKILATAFALKATKKHPFSDVSASYNDVVSALYATGITTGDNGKFKEKDTLNRQHYSVFLYRAFNYVEKATGSASKPQQPTKTNLVTDTGTKKTQEKLLELRTEHAEVFKEDVPLNTVWFDNNPISMKILEEGMGHLKALDMYLSAEGTNSYVSDYSVTFDGYKNPTERLGKTAVTFVGTGDKYGKFSFDFREEKAEKLTLEWLEIAFPQLADQLAPMVKEKAQDARKNLHDETHYNMELILIDGYEVQIGVNTFKEMFVLDLSKPRK